MSCLNARGVLSTLASYVPADMPADAPVAAFAIVHNGGVSSNLVVFPRLIGSFTVRYSDTTERHELYETPGPSVFDSSSSSGWSSSS